MNGLQKFQKSIHVIALSCHRGIAWFKAREGAALPLVDLLGSRCGTHRLETRSSQWNGTYMYIIITRKILTTQVLYRTTKHYYPCTSNSILTTTIYTAPRSLRTKIQICLLMTSVLLRRYLAYSLLVHLCSRYIFVLDATPWRFCILLDPRVLHDVFKTKPLAWILN